jgi:hypothetical protein
MNETVAGAPVIHRCKADFFEKSVGYDIRKEAIRE